MVQNTSKAAKVGSDRQRRWQKSQLQKQPASYQRMYHERALGLLSPKERKLIEGFFDEDGQQTTRLADVESGPRRKALARYGSAREEVIGHMKKRRTENDKFVISVPEFIWLQPDLSFMEKHLLADVFALQQGKRGCFKSNWAFAVELGTTEGNIKDMIYRLQKHHFLGGHQDKEGRRVLALTTEFLRLVGQCPLTGPSVPTDDEVSAHLPERQSPLTSASVPTDDEAEQNTDESRMDIGESDDDGAPRHQGDIKREEQQPQAEAAARQVVVKKAKSGAAAPGPLPGGFAPSTPATQSKQKQKPEAKPKQAGHSTSPATGATRPSADQDKDSGERKSPVNDAKRSSAGAKDKPANAPPAQSAKARKDSLDEPVAGSKPPAYHATNPALADGEPESQARKLLQVYEKLYGQYFGKDYSVKQQDVDIATRYFQDRPERIALEVANYLVRAWELRDQQDGDYGYGCCKQASSVPGFFKFLERADGKRGIAEDVESRFNCYWGCDEESLIKSLSKVCDNQEVVDDVFADVCDQIKEQKKAEAEDEAIQKAEAEKQEEAARQALIDNPSREQLESACDVLQKAYQIALGIQRGMTVPDNRVHYSCRVLRFDAPALREWYAHGTGRRPAPTDWEDNVPDNLRIRLKDEYDGICKAVAKLRKAAEQEGIE